MKKKKLSLRLDNMILKDKIGKKYQFKKKNIKEKNMSKPKLTLLTHHLQHEIRIKKLF
jgi:hypothetical protein